MRTRRWMVVGLVALMVLIASVVPALGQQPPTRQSQLVTGDSLTITAEVVSFAPTTREITLKGPLGGVVAGHVSTDVKDVSKLTPGSMVSVTYFEALAASVKRKGESQPLISASDVAAKVQPGMPVGAPTSVTKSYTIDSVDVDTNRVVFKNSDGLLIPISVKRPEFQAKLKDLKVGDQVDVTYSDAMVTSVKPVAPGEEAKITMKTGTIVIDKGDVVRKIGSTLYIRNESGRMVKVAVDPKFKFMLNGKEATVADIQEGTRLTRTALRVTETSYSSE